MTYAATLQPGRPHLYVTRAPRRRASLRARDRRTLRHLAGHVRAFAR